MAKEQRTAPILFSGNVPDAQQKALQLVGHALDNLDYYFRCLEADLQLFDKCAAELRRKPARQRWRDWQFVAARDGAINIYNFYESMRSLGASLHECPHVKSRLNYNAIKLAQKNFKEEFPNVEQIRHAVGHAAEKTQGSQKHAAHGYTGRYMGRTKVRNFVMIDGLQGRKYSNTWRGRIESYRLSKSTLKRIMAARDTIFDAFDEMNAIFNGN
jgi:hypothetical protein